MERYTIEQRDKVVRAYYENGRSNQKTYRALRYILGQFNRPNVRTIGKIVKKFEKTGSVKDVKTPVHARSARTAENIAAVRDSLAAEPSISIRRRAQQLQLSRSSLMNIMQKDLQLHPNKERIADYKASIASSTESSKRNRKRVKHQSSSKTALKVTPEEIPSDAIHKHLCYFRFPRKSSSQ
ncbi:uncharacterized protein LOC129948269 [Eupeodes corollae]|uniref:uncharacterized protein LOC129948269 n=1 Tax=Eupeodes corollae TaxID=290404 RepID=UPI0024931307|nr:uncharacterized protein LOC129948269 [Eupeodes corollae]